MNINIFLICFSLNIFKISFLFLLWPVSYLEVCIYKQKYISVIDLKLKRKRLWLTGYQFYCVAEISVYSLTVGQEVNTCLLN